MAPDQWSKVDTYIVEKLLGDADPVFQATLAANAAGGLPPIDVSPAQGKFLNLMAKIIGARRILEIGTLGGYSTLWMAKALPEDGRLVTLEFSPRHAAVAADNFARAGLSNRIDLRVGAALDSLPQLAAEGAGPFDLVFIDADKPNNPGYLDWAVKLGRPGTVIILDNVVRGGGVVDPRSVEPSIVGTRAAFDLLAGHPEMEATALQTVGLKGWDGFVLGRIRA